ncbi:arylsulfatase L [Meriones unguiculatus]|uniref:arylsulfatase L n=1 Tax=Meriones unguiculatus TaxID=10047 RepID=UPI00293EA222|nr:arylsulfatase L [Meriones unguiculatus]XP_060230797.1 arylsulfatase L [Meriones unguiculatus]XP_060230798.1 arylsulfatase L [Meriones unguiculatus]XP_060230799.1 arylsulfatase L [Meriones unguiculatus]XP_060230800.1 arylsulfatase L [Meriones unguiculatus]
MAFAIMIRLLVACLPVACLRAPPPRPNFLLLMADDLGIGDIGCYGNRSLRTPNIDRLASEGVMLTQHLAASSLCTPSRAAFLTGRYPIRSGMTSARGHRVLQWAAGAGGLPPEEITFARILQEQGYVTGLLGKWHLGLSCSSATDFCHHPHRHGFSHFMGLPLGMMGDCAPPGGVWPPPPQLESWPSEKRAVLEQRLSWWARLFGAGAAGILITAVMMGSIIGHPFRLRVAAAILACVLAAVAILASVIAHHAGELVARADCFLMRGAEVTQQPLRLDRVTDMLLHEAEVFLSLHSDQPFLLLMSFLHTHIPLVTKPDFQGRSQHGVYGDNVEELDWMVGRLLSALDHLGLTENTLVYFTSDNGAWLEAGSLGGSNGVFRGGKGMGGWEGGFRVPGVFRFPGVLPEGRVVDEPTSLMDVFPTVVGLAGGALPEDREIDGRDLLPLLRGETPHSGHHILLHFCEIFLHAARFVQRDAGKTWKLHFMTPNPDPSAPGQACPSRGVCPCVGDIKEHDPPLLFELGADPGEMQPLLPGAEPALFEALHAVQWEHKRVIEGLGPSGTVRQQLGTLYNVWRPWLQPCCGAWCACDLE